MNIDELDFLSLRFYNGEKVVSAYYNKQVDVRAACCLDNGRWALYSLQNNDWWTDASYPKSDLIRGGWQKIIDNNQVFPVADKAKFNKVDNACVCSMTDLWNYGCPSARGIKCRSKT